MVAMNATGTQALLRRPWLARAALAMSVVLLAACASTQSAPIGPTSTGKTIRSAATSEPESVPVIESSVEAEPGVAELEIYEGTGTFIKESAAVRPKEPVAEDGEIVLNFEGESIQSVVHTILGEVLQETFVIGPGVSGEVTFSTSKPVSRDELMPILELLLRWNGATLVYSEGRYHVLPVSNAIKGTCIPRWAVPSARVATRCGRCR
jgi:general secretion pathway protein D